MAARRRNAYGRRAEHAEARGLIEQGNVDAARVAAVRHDISVAQAAEQAASRQVGEHAVVLHLAERHELRRAVATQRGEGAGQPAEFGPVARRVPATLGFGLELPVVETGVATRVEKVLHVPLHHPEALGAGGER